VCDLVKWITLHLSGLKDICHSLSHCSSVSMSCWRSLQSSSVFIGRNKRLSSAKSLVEELGVESGRSFMYRRKRRGPRTVPCGTPEETGTGSEDTPSSKMRWVLHVKKAVIQ